MRKLTAVSLLVALMTLEATCRASCQTGGLPSVERLSDLPTCIVAVKQGWGELGINVSAHAPGKTPLPLQIYQRRYSRGLGNHAPGEIVVALDGRYSRFSADVGVQWQGGGNNGSVVFQAFVDGRKQFDSGVMRQQDSARHVSLDVTGADELRLVATDAGDGIICDCADWVNTELMRNPASRRVTSSEELDIAPFGRVLSWDPARRDGAHCIRTQEFPASDVFLGAAVARDAAGRWPVPRFAGGRGCLGLRWAERRRINRLQVVLSPDSALPNLHEVTVEGWFGESAWQGHWEPLPGIVEGDGRTLTFRLQRSAAPSWFAGTEKIRWIFPDSPRPVVLSRMSAFTYTRWKPVRILLQAESARRRQHAVVGIYNGEILSSKSAQQRYAVVWDLSQPLLLDVLCARTHGVIGDRTTLRLRLGDGAFAVSLDDVLAHRYVYVPSYGTLVSSYPTSVTPAGCQRRIAQHKTVLDRVRTMPDQTFVRALMRVHHTIQDRGPMMLSLACDNQKFVVSREGEVEKGPLQMAPQGGDGNRTNFRRSLDGGWLPAPITEYVSSGLVYRQRTCVIPSDPDDVRTVRQPGWLNRKPLCISEFVVENPGKTSAEARLKLHFASTDAATPLLLFPDGDRFVVTNGRDLLACVDLQHDSPLKASLSGTTLSLQGSIAAGGHAGCAVLIPGWSAARAEASSLHMDADPVTVLRAYWQHVLASAMQIAIPNPALLNVIRAAQVDCLIAARNEDDGTRVAPWIASMSYGPLESEAHSVIRGMDLMGHHEFARRGLDFFIHRYNAAGYLTTGYTMMGTGWHLWTLADHYFLTHDSTWLRRVAPEVARVCRWIMIQRRKTEKLDVSGHEVPEYGLMPPGVSADWNRFAYRFAMQGHFCAGLRAAAAALADIGYPGAATMVADGDAFRNDVLRAYRWTQARCPVLPLSNGGWVPAYPSALYDFGPSGELYPGEDGGRSWCYDIELGAHHLIPLGILDAHSPDAVWMTEQMEDYWFLHDGMGDYPESQNRKDWFDLGGFSKVQPYYCRVAEIYAARDDVKPFIRSYFNALCSLLNTETLTLWEHFHNQGAWNKTHETGWFLQQMRLMYVMERGDALWLAPFVPSTWMRDGAVVAVRDAPTVFGPVAYRITSHVAAGYIEAEVEPPARQPPADVMLRLRHPQGKPMRTVTVNGAAWKCFDRRADCIHLGRISSLTRITVRY